MFGPQLEAFAAVRADALRQDGGHRRQRGPGRIRVAAGRRLVHVGYRVLGGPGAVRTMRIVGEP